MNKKIMITIIAFVLSSKYKTTLNWTCVQYTLRYERFIFKLYKVKESKIFQYQCIKFKRSRKMTFEKKKLKKY